MENVPPPSPSSCSSSEKKSKLKRTYLENKPLHKLPSSSRSKKLKGTHTKQEENRKQQVATHSTECHGYRIYIRVLREHFCGGVRE